MAARTGKQSRQGLHDGRELWAGGDEVFSITDHATLAEVFDLQQRSELPG